MIAVLILNNNNGQIHLNQHVFIYWNKKSNIIVFVMNDTWEEMKVHIDSPCIHIMVDMTLSPTVGYTKIGILSVYITV